MDNENEIIPENEQEQEIVVVEEEEIELSVEDKLAKAQAEANKWRRIANKKPDSKPQITNPDLSDELKLIARGLSDEEIEQAKVVAKGKGVSLTEAIKDPLFITFQDKIKEEKKKEDAKLGATRGSGESQDETLVKPDMSREEHMKVFKKVMGH